MDYVILLKSGGAPDVREISVNTDASETPESLSETLIGCEYAELVRPVGMLGKYGFYVDESGVLYKQPANYYASALYGTDEHFQPICGDAVVVRLNPDYSASWLDAEDIPEIKRMIEASEMRFRTNMEEIIRKYRRDH